MTLLQHSVTLAMTSLLLMTGAACSAALSWDEEIADPALLAGDGLATEFAAYAPGDQMVLHTGIQVGVWLMPVVRHQGMAGEPQINCLAVDLDKDQILAEGAAHTLSLAAEGWHDVQYNMQVTLPDLESTSKEDLLAYEGDRVLFECESQDTRGLSLSISLEMILDLQ